jgi:hypothetical protein
LVQVVLVVLHKQQQLLQVMLELLAVILLLALT